VKNGTHEEWLQDVNDPRYVIQQLKRGLPAQDPRPGRGDAAENHAQGTGRPVKARKIKARKVA